MLKRTLARIAAVAFIVGAVGSAVGVAHQGGPESGVVARPMPVCGHCW